MVRKGLSPPAPGLAAGIWPGNPVPPGPGIGLRPAPAPVIRGLALAALLSATPTAWAGEEGTFVGGGADTQVGVVAGAGVVGQSQAELDLRYARGPFFLRFDADTTLAYGDGGAQLVWTPPEWAMAQVGGDTWRGRGGILNPQVGYEDWDAWLNPLPTWSVMFNAATPGRILGAELERSLSEDMHVFAWAGLDIDWAGSWNGRPPGVGDVPGFGVGVRGELESFSTWSGVFAVPSDGFYAAVYTFDLYPADALTLLFDGAAGLSAGAGFAGGQVVATVLPEGAVSPVARAEWVVDPGGRALGGWAAGVPAGTGSLGLRSQPLDPLILMLEAKASLGDGELHPGLWLGVELVRPEPAPFSIEPE